MISSWASSFLLEPHLWEERNRLTLHILQVVVGTGKSRFLVCANENGNTHLGLWHKFFVQVLVRLISRYATNDLVNCTERNTAWWNFLTLTRGLFLNKTRERNRFINTSTCLCNLCVRNVMCLFILCVGVFFISKQRKNTCVHENSISLVVVISFLLMASVYVNKKYTSNTPTCVYLV